MITSTPEWDCIIMPNPLPIPPDREMRVTCYYDGELFGAALRISNSAIFSLQVETLGLSSQNKLEVYTKYVKSCVERLTYMIKGEIVAHTKQLEEEAEELTEQVWQRSLFP